MGLIVLHAGMAKAGSSSIQRWLAANGAVLASDRGIHLVRIVQQGPDAPIEVVPYTTKHALSMLVAVQPLDRSRRKDEAELRADAKSVFDQLDALARARGTVVVTSEAYQLPFWRGDDVFLSGLDELARQHTVRVAYYVRPQHTAMEAAWRQWGFREPSPPSEFLRRRIRQLDYLRTLVQVRELAPNVSFEVRPFRDDLLEGGDVVTDFAATFLGAEDLVSPSSDERRANRGFPLDLVMLLREGKDRFWSWRGDNERLDELRDIVTRWDIPDSEHVRRSREVLQQFCHRRFEPDNRRLIATLGWETPAFVPPPEGVVPASPPDCDELAMLDELWTSTASDTLRELVFCALAELLPSSQDRFELASVGEARGA